MMRVDDEMMSDELRMASLDMMPSSRLHAPGIETSSNPDSDNLRPKASDRLMPPDIDPKLITKQML